MKQWIWMGWVLMSASTAWADGCNLPRVVGSCTMSEGGLTTECVDFAGSDATYSTIRANCTGVASPDPCSNTGLVGSCKVGDDSDLIVERYYSPLPASTVGPVCMAKLGTQC